LGLTAGTNDPLPTSSNPPKRSTTGGAAIDWALPEAGEE
jgi:hypothetical protein